MSELEITPGTLRMERAKAVMDAVPPIFAWRNWFGLTIPTLLALALAVGGASWLLCLCAGMIALLSFLDGVIQSRRYVVVRAAAILDESDDTESCP